MSEPKKGKRQSIIGNARASQTVDPEDIPKDKPKSQQTPKNNKNDEAPAVKKEEPKIEAKTESNEVPKEKFAKPSKSSTNVPTRASRRKKDKDKRKSWISGVGKRLSGFFSK